MLVLLKNLFCALIFFFFSGFFHLSSSIHAMELRTSGKTSSSNFMEVILDNIYNSTYTSLANDISLKNVVNEENGIDKEATQLDMDLNKKAYQLLDMPLLRAFLSESDIKNLGEENFKNQVEKSYKKFEDLLKENNNEVNTSWLQLLLNLYLQRSLDNFPKNISLLDKFQGCNKSYTYILLTSLVESKHYQDNLSITSSDIEMQGCLELGRLIKRNQIRKKLVLKNNMVQNVPIIITALKEKNIKLKNIVLNNIGIKDFHIDTLSKLENSNTYLENLDLRNNKITFDSLKALTKMINNYPSLKTFKISGESFDRKSCIILEREVKNPTSKLIIQ